MSFFVRNFLLGNGRPRLVWLSQSYTKQIYNPHGSTISRSLCNQSHSSQSLGSQKYTTNTRSYTTKTLSPISNTQSYIIRSQNYSTNGQPLKIKVVPERQPQMYKYFLIVDLEATCDKVAGNPPIQEIIEFPVLKMNAETLQIESQFHEYVKPRLFPELTDFCKSLTGITQEQIDSASAFPAVLGRFEAWLKQEVGREEHLFVTCGDWDLLTQLPRSCKAEQLRLPHALRKWHNVKQSYNSVARHHTTNMKGMLEGLKLEPENKIHRGIADCQNIANIVGELITKKGLVLEPNKKVHKFQS